MSRSHAQLRRLYQIDASLLGGAYPSAAELARQLGVTRGTIHRDLQVLRSAYRAPVSFDPSKAGYAYGHAFRADLPDLPAEEAIELARAVFHRGAPGNSALGECLLRLVQRLSRVLPAGEQPPPGHTPAVMPRTPAGTRKAPAGPVGERVPMTLRFDRAVTDELLAAGLFERREVQLLTGGGFEVQTTVTDPDTFLLSLLRWAPHFEIAGPPWARRRLPQLLRRLLRQLEPRRKTGRTRRGR